MSAPVVVLTGVSGAGKSTVGRSLADALGAELVDADDHHPPANVAKMAAGEPLTDADRGPWIDVLVAELRRLAAQGHRVVLACSALRRAHRVRLASAVPGGVVVHLHVDPEDLVRRLGAREGHFMPAALLQSQLDALEPPLEAEAVIVDGSAPVDDVVAQVLARLGS